jgi:hypothetical protein
MSNLDTINKQLAAATEALAKVDADLAWQATGVAADIAGTVDPTPISDLVSAGVSVRNGDLWGAALSTVSMVPYLGDAVAKPVKAVRATKAIAGLTEKATALRKTITDLTKAKKEAEATVEITAKEAKIAKEAEAAKDTAAQQEKSAAKKAKDCENCNESDRAEKPNTSSNGPYRGGPHSQTKLPVGDGLDSHHLPADAISPIPREKGPAIKMDPADHKETSSNGSGLDAVEYRSEIREMIESGRMRDAMATEIKDVRRAAKLVSGNQKKYNEAIREMLEYSKKMEWLNKKGK